MTQQPQGLGKTLDDFKRLGKGVAVGETFDLVGAPADLADAFFSIRKSLFPYSDLGEAKAAEDLAKGIGSEALIRKAGVDIPEMGFNLESAGRVVAPGFLLTKGAVGLKLLSQLMNKTPPPSGGLAMATTVGSKLPTPPPQTTGEQLMMTTDANLPSSPREPERAQIFEDDYLRKDVNISSSMSKDGVFFSNLLQEIENIGTGQSRLGELISERLPVYKKDAQGNLIKNKKGKPIPEKGPDGRVIFGDETRTRVEGIDFSTDPTGADILERFKTLKGGINSRLYKEAEEVGLIRYLELNPEEKFGANGGKEKLYNIASQFTPEIEVNVYKESDQLALDSQISQLKNQVAEPTLPQQEKTDLLTQIRDLEDMKRRSNTGMSNKGAQRIDPGGDSVYDVVHTIFGTGSKGNKILGSSVDRFNSTNTVKKAYEELEDFLKSAGDTDSLKELKQSYSEHGFNSAVDGGYYAHGRAVDGFMGFELGANAPKLEDSRFVNELQINQGMTKNRKLIQDSPERIAEVQRNIANQTQRVIAINDKIAQMTNDYQAGKITRDQLNDFNNAAQKKIVDINTVISSLNKSLNNKNDIVLNSTLMDIQQVLKLDKENDIGISTFTETKNKLQEDAKLLIKEKDEFMTEYDKLEKFVTPLKEKVFKVDSDVNTAAVSQSLYNMNKSAITRFFDEDVAQPTFNSDLFAILPTAKGTTVTLQFDGILGNFDKNSVIQMNASVPDSIKRFIKNRFTQQEAENLILKGGNTADTTRSAKLSFVNRGIQVQGDFKDNSLFSFLNRGRDAKVIDRGLLRDYYETVDRLTQNKKINPAQFDETSRGLGIDKGKEARGMDINFAKYVQMKILDNPDYFKDPKNVSKFFKDAYRNHGLELEQKYIKAAAVKNIVNDNEFRRLVGKDNIKELAQRLEAADKARRTNFDDIPNVFDSERRKVLQDFIADAELDRAAKTKGSKIVEKIINKTIDEYTLQNNSIPTPLSTGNNRVSFSRKIKGSDGFLRYKADLGVENVVDFTYTPPKKILGVTAPGARGTVDFKFVDLSPEAQKNAVKQDLYGDIHRNVFSEYRNPIIESMANQERLSGLDAEKAVAEERARKLVDKINNLKEKLRPFEQRGAMLKLIEKLGDKVPPKMKESLKETLKHVNPNESFQLAKNPPVQDSQQGLEMMVHRMVSDAKKEGKRYLIFPKLADYAAPRSSGDPKKYNFAAGTQQLGSILKKYGDAYFTKERVFSSSTDIPPVSNRMIEIGKVRGGPVNEESDLFRIIDLSKIDSDLKIPRFAKGGIFNKFRKVA